MIIPRKSYHQPICFLAQVIFQFPRSSCIASFLSGSYGTCQPSLLLSTESTTLCNWSGTSIWGGSHSRFLALLGLTQWTGNVMDQRRIPWKMPMMFMLSITHTCFIDSNHRSWSLSLQERRAVGGGNSVVAYSYLKRIISLRRFRCKSYLTRKAAIIGIRRQRVNGSLQCKGLLQEEEGWRKALSKTIGQKKTYPVKGTNLGHTTYKGSCAPTDLLATILFISPSCSSTP